MSEADKDETAPAKDNSGVHLGIGTLIIIAIIVTMCSGRGEMEKIQQDTRSLKQQLDVIEKKLDSLAQKESATPDAGVDSGAPAQEPQVE